MALNDLVELATTVTAVSGNTVTLASVTGLAVGDKIIIESQHGYDEVGLDGDWAISLPVTTNYYLNVTHIGKSFLGTISAISGNTITVDRSVPAGAVGLPCYRNNADAIEYAINNRLAWPVEQSFAFATSNTRPLRCYTTPDQYTYDFNGCEIFSPRGCGPAALGVWGLGGGPTANKIYRNLQIRGNVRDAGYGVSAETGAYFQGSSLPPAFNVSGTSGGGGSVTSNQHIENFVFIDNWRSVTIVLADSCTVKNCTSLFTGPLRSYVQWEYQAASSSNCTFQSCIVDSDYARPGFEPFACFNVQYVACGGRNTSFASNSSGPVLFSDCYIAWDEENPVGTLWSPYNPLMTLNRTIEIQQGTPVSGTTGYVRVENFSVVYNNNPYTDQIMNTVSIDPGTQGIDMDVEILGLHLSVTGNPSTPNSGYAVRSDAAMCRLSNYSGPILPGRHVFVRQNVPVQWNNTRGALIA